MRLMKSKYFTLNELIDEGLFTNFLTNYPLSSLAYEGFSTTYTTVINGFISLFSIRYGESYILRKDYEFFDTEPEIETADVTKIARRIQNLLNLTANRYLSLLQAYNKYVGDPTGQITSTNTNEVRFNDTPQNNGDYISTDHTTNITYSESTTSADTSSILERLDSLYKNWRNILKDWTSEFMGMFKEIWED